MKVVIRADGNDKIGIGHAMRCIAIAEELILNGHAVHLLTTDLTVVSLFQSYVSAFTCDLIELDSPENIKNRISVYFGNSAGAIIVDKYGLDSAYFENLVPNVLVKVIFIDDFLTAKNNVDLFINPALSDRSHEYLLKNVRGVSGSKYLCLRKEIRAYRKNKVDKKVKSVLLTSGGTDVKSMLLSIAKDLLLKTNWEINILIGPGFSQLDGYEALVKTNKRVSLYSNINEVVNRSLLIKWATIDELCEISDVCFSSLGTTCYEMIFKRVPLVGFVAIDNQNDNLRMLIENDLIVPLGNEKSFNSDDLNIAVNQISNFEIRKNLFVKYENQIDGRGAERIVKILEEMLNV